MDGIGRPGGAAYPFLSGVSASALQACVFAKPSRQLFPPVVTDVDECAEGKHGCSQACLNVAGSYSCSCQNGHTLQADGKTCHAPEGPNDVTGITSPGKVNMGQAVSFRSCIRCVRGRETIRMCTKENIVQLGRNPFLGAFHGNSLELERRDLSGPGLSGPRGKSAQTFAAEAGRLHLFQQDGPWWTHRKLPPLKNVCLPLKVSIVRSDTQLHV